MSYLGKVDMNDANIKHYSLTGSTLTTVNIGWVPASEQSLRVTINGVVQQGDTFSYSGANLTLGGPLVATDTLEVVGIESVGRILVPADDSVTAAKLADDAVTTAKINDDAVTTAKILNDNVTLAKMAGLARGSVIVGDASGDPSALALGASTYLLTSDGSDAAWAAPAAGLNVKKFYFGKDIADAVTTTTLTGFGFTAKVVYIFGVPSPDSNEWTSMGFSVSGSHQGMAHGAGGWTRVDSRTVRFYNTMSSNYYRAGYVSTFGTDGITITWDAKVGTPTGTLACYGIAWG